MPETLAEVREFVEARGGRVTVRGWGCAARLPARMEVVVRLAGHSESGLTGEWSSSSVPMGDRVDEVARACLHQVWQRIRTDAGSQLVDDAAEMLVAGW